MCLDKWHKACPCRAASGSRHCGKYPPSSSCDRGWAEKHERDKERVRVRLCRVLLERVTTLDRPRSLEPAAVLDLADIVCWQHSFLIRRSVCGASRHRRRCEVPKSGSRQGWAPPRAHPLALAPHAQASRARHPLLHRIPGTCLAGPRPPDRRPLLPRPCNVARCGKGGIGADDVGPRCRVVKLVTISFTASRVQRMSRLCWPAMLCVMLAMSSGWCWISRPT